LSSHKKGKNTLREILLIEDDRGMSDGIVLRMQQKPYRFTQAFSMEETSEPILFRKYSLIILDLDFSQGKGLELIKQIRKVGDTPLLILMKKREQLSQKQGYDLGADDCITKPFLFQELLEKIENVMKQNLSDAKVEYRFRNLSFQFEDNLYFKNTEEIHLTDTEKILLRLLVEYQGTALSQGFLEKGLWKDDDRDHPELKTLIRSLREKLEANPDEPQFLHTVYGRGYTWKEKEAF